MSRARLPAKGLLAALAVALMALGGGPDARAADIIFDPDGGAVGNGDRDILGLDWLPGNSVSIAAVPITGPGQTFIGLYQAKLGATTGDSSPIAGLNTTFEITVVARFREVVDLASSSGGLGSANFHSDANQTGSFLEIYYNDLTVPGSVAANDLTGAGFTDGTLILAGNILPGNPGDSGFTTQFTRVGLLDQAGDDDRGGQLTVSGSGGSILSTSVTFVNTAFFKTGGISILTTEFNTSLVDPFRQVDPSIAFFVGDPRAYTPSLGATNGVSGGDFLFQADANQTIITAVPEPGTMVLAFTGLATVSLGSLRKLRRRLGAPAA